MNRLGTATVLLLATVVLLAPATLLAGQLASSYPLTAGPSLAERSAAVAERFAEITATEIAAGLSSPIAVRVHEPSRYDIQPDGLSPAERRVLVGVSQSVGAEISFLEVEKVGTAPQSLTHGALAGNGAGGFSWTGSVNSAGASALRIHFTDFFLPGNASLYLYAADGQVLGPYFNRGPQGNGDFWSGTVFGDEIRMQLRYDGVDTGRVLRAARFVVDDVAHLGSKLRLALGYRLANGGPTLVERATCSYNESCVNNGNSGAPGVTAAAQDGVAHILFASGGFQYICSGGLIADTVQSNTPYFLTANHCISRGREAKSLETFFHYDTGCSAPYGSGGDTVGADILSTSRTSDYTLMQLWSNPPGTTTAIGWNNSPIAFANGATLHRISHPKGASQTYSQHEVDTSRGTCTSWPRGNWIYSGDVVGATEGGSSGSPVLDSSGLVVGQLSGACGTNVNDTCDSVSNATVDGALAAYFSNVSQWLDPSGCGTEICGDGIDNDCDGLVDEGCGGPCDLGQPGDSCSSDSECCSNKCKGKPGSKTCN